ncbi:hypothetical protein L484_017061 [Morus notabilis]|uniref:Uncharacterized protein n=1 Tax=Morus notabilis TaxID=981085 RepID=W9SAH3_9ROSA|nr:hypothetical protein L484_017061 [Morus notabilis]
MFGASGRSSRLRDSLPTTDLLATSCFFGGGKSSDNESTTKLISRGATGEPATKGKTKEKIATGSLAGEMSQVAMRTAVRDLQRRLIFAM